MSLRFAIVGFGVVGKSMKSLLPDAVVYDTAPGMPHDKQEVNQCDITFVCVPTPAASDGSCDISIVEDSVEWIETSIIVIRSTVPPGTTKRLGRNYNKRIVFNPEYLGETPWHPYRDAKNIPFTILGGPRKDTAEVAEVYGQMYGPSVRIYLTDSTTAELAKYMSNCFFATKVVFCNEFYRIANAFGVEYHELREIWLADPRLSRDHTLVFPSSPGFGGKCLPKDLSALIFAAQKAGHGSDFLRMVKHLNGQFQGGDSSTFVQEARYQIADV
jgi:UDPglucose 6-dehydrogenase